MRTIIAGSRTIEDYSLVERAVRESDFEITEIVSGGACGVDRLGEKYARTNGIPLVIFAADWSAYGRVAGFIRNQRMANYADALIAVWDGFSSGTQHMIHSARKRGLKVHVLMYPTKPSSELW